MCESAFYLRTITFCIIISCYGNRINAQNDRPIQSVESGYLLAYKAYRNDSFELARQHCLAILKIKPNWGQPRLLLGNMYANSSRICAVDSNDYLLVSGIISAAIHEWQLAKKIDANLIKKANKSIERYARFLPTKNELFQAGLLKKRTYHIGCWIDRKVTLLTVEDLE